MDLEYSKLVVFKTYKLKTLYSKLILKYSKYCFHQMLQLVNKTLWRSIPIKQNLLLIHRWDVLKEEHMPRISPKIKIWVELIQEYHVMRLFGYKIFYYWDTFSLALSFCLSTTLIKTIALCVLCLCYTLWTISFNILNDNVVN